MSSPISRTQSAAPGPTAETVSTCPWAAASAGAAAAYLAFAFGAQQGGVGGWLLAGGCLALGALSYVLVARKVPTAVLTAMAALLAGCLGAWL